MIKALETFRNCTRRGSGQRQSLVVSLWLNETVEIGTLALQMASAYNGLDPRNETTGQLQLWWLGILPTKLPTYLTGRAGTKRDCRYNYADVRRTGGDLLRYKRTG